MLSIGYQIKQANDILHQTTLSNLVDRIARPEPRFVDFINQMRSVMILDVKKYREMKTRLPYIVAANFSPPYRRIENFGSCSCFILDLDHLADKEIDKQQLFRKICDDHRTALCFTSPSGDGLKVLLKLNKPFYDPGKYSVFYRAFAQTYAQQLGVSQVIDKVTSDVSRACFVSYDPDVYLNENSQPIDSNSFVDFENQLQLHDMLQQQKETLKATIEPNPAATSRQDLPEDLLQRIKERLSPLLKEKAEKKIFVPVELESVIPLITEQLAAVDLHLESVKNINYGKQLKVTMQHWWGEINIFYGKKGFSIVKSTKSGSSEKLTDIAANIIQLALQQ